MKSADQILMEARNLDKYQKKALHVAIKFAQDIIIARKGTAPYPKVPPPRHRRAIFLGHRVPSTRLSRYPG